MEGSLPSHLILVSAASASEGEAPGVDGAVAGIGLTLVMTGIVLAQKR